MELDGNKGIGMRMNEHWIRDEWGLSIPVSSVP